MNIFLHIVPFWLLMSVLYPQLKTLPFFLSHYCWEAGEPQAQYRLSPRQWRKLQDPRSTGNLFHKVLMRLVLQNLWYNKQKVNQGPSLKTRAGRGPVTTLLDFPGNCIRTASHPYPGQVCERLIILSGAWPHQFQIKKSLRPQFFFFALKILDPSEISWLLYDSDQARGHAGSRVRGMIYFNAQRLKAQQPQARESRQTKTGRMGTQGRGSADFKSLSKVATTQVKWRK